MMQMKPAGVQARPLPICSAFIACRDLHVWHDMTPLQLLMSSLSDNQQRWSARDGQLLENPLLLEKISRTL